MKDSYATKLYTYICTFTALYFQNVNIFCESSEKFLKIKV